MNRMGAGSAISWISMIQVLFLEHYTKLVLFCEFFPCLSGGPRAPVPAVHGLRGDVEGLRHRSGGDGVPFLLGCSAHLPRGLLVLVLLPSPRPGGHEATRPGQCSREARGAQPLPRLAQVACTFASSHVPAQAEPGARMSMPLVFQGHHNP